MQWSPEAQSCQGEPGALRMAEVCCGREVDILELFVLHSHTHAKESFQIVLVSVSAKA